MPRTDVDRIAVIVPAADEEELVGETIRSVWAAADQVDVPVELVVVANGCSDRTAEVAADRGAHVVVDPGSNVGVARALGSAWAMRRGTSGLWLAHTDADSIVPTHWLSTFLRCAAGGHDVVLGTIVLPVADRHRHRAWVERYARTDRHVHGANLGVRASTYRDVGGFSPLAAHEDVDLVDRARAAGASTTWVRDCAVETSARTDPRAPAGVGRDLAEGQPA